jgi:hypothetical protein
MFIEATVRQLIAKSFILMARICIPLSSIADEEIILDPSSLNSTLQ